MGTKIKEDIDKRTSQFLEELGYNNVIGHSVEFGDTELDDEIRIYTINGIARVKYLNPGVQGKLWSVKDLEARAEQLAGDDWENVFDKDTFEATLTKIVDEHDANIGINWDVISDYLDIYSKK